jgi:hypothetical protein
LGEVGAFRLPIWKAQQIALDMLVENGLDENSAYVEWAFPKRGGADNGFNVTEIAAHRRGDGAA